MQVKNDYMIKNSLWNTGYLISVKERVNLIGNQNDLPFYKQNLVKGYLVLWGESCGGAVELPEQ